MSDIVLVHGFNVSDGGKASIDRLKPYLYDHNVIEFDYGWLGFFGVRFNKKKRAMKLVRMTPDGAVGIGHSNGCLELIRACKLGAKYKRLIFVNPALDNDIEIPEQLERVDVYYHPDDTVVTLSKFRPFLYWGDMGRVGYQGCDDRVVNHDVKELFGLTGTGAVAHSIAFRHSYQLASHAGLCQ